MSPDGQFAVCGLFNGTVFFYRADTMRYFTQISCRNRRGRHREGRKVCFRRKEGRRRRGDAGERTDFHRRAGHWAGLPPVGEGRGGGGIQAAVLERPTKHSFPVESERRQEVPPPGVDK
eukprot:scaffold1311_cov256-Pinguiococcus_pyrenoidosus.AAC.64